VDVGRDETEPVAGTRAPAVVYTDVHGEPTNDAAAAVRGEITEFDGHGRPRRLTRFFLLDEDRAPKWLPVSEAAFLLWVLAALIVAWLVIGVILGLV
jgi:hypothetical protein